MREFFIGLGSRKIVIGQPGSGKTTWSEWLQNEALRPPNSKLAVVIPLRELSASDLPSLQQLVRNAVGKHVIDEVEPKHIHEWANSGRIALIFDGFDEIAPSNRDDTINWLNELADQAGSTCIILTSRPLTTDHLDRLNSFLVQCKIQPFDEGRVVDYVQRWYRFSPLLQDDQRNVDAHSLGETWLEDPVIGPLTGNPLVLTTLCVVHHLDGDLPKGRAKLYERYVEGMLGLWDEKRKIGATETVLTRSQRQLVLTRVALHFHLSEIEQLDEKETLELVAKILSESGIAISPQESLALLRERTGLLIGPGIYSFVHKSVSEFLVAQVVVDGDQRDETGERIDRMRLFKERHNDRWNTVLFFWAGLAPLADLQNFIDCSIQIPGADDFELPLGLLYDQIERLRLTKQWSREALIRLLNKSFWRDGSAFSGWTVPFLPSKNERTENLILEYVGPKLADTYIWVPCEIRSISKISEDATDALVALFEAMDLHLKDVPNTHTEVFRAVWVGLLVGASDPKFSLECLNFEDEGTELPTTRHLFYLYRIGSLIAKNSGDRSVQEAINFAVAAWPEIAPIIPLYLCARFIDATRAAGRLYTREFFRAIAKADLQQINEDWLRESYNIRLADFHYRPLDVLSEFEKSLEEAIERGEVPNDEHATAVRKSVKELILRRRQLLSSAPER